MHPGCAQVQGQGQRSHHTATFVLAGKRFSHANDRIKASSLQSNISSISVTFARWKHHCGRSLLSTIALFPLSVDRPWFIIIVVVILPRLEVLTICININQLFFYLY